MGRRFYELRSGCFTIVGLTVGEMALCCMENFKSHKREIFWYNINVPRQRSSAFFDIGGRHPAPAIGPKPVSADGKTPVGRDDLIAPPLVGTAFHRRPRGIDKSAANGRARSPSAPFRGAAETHPTPAACTQHQRIGFRGKAANFTQRKTEYDGASRGNHAAYPPFLFFVEALSGACHETGF